MSGSSNSFFSKLLNNVFPKVPDFYGMIGDQCNIVVESADLLVVFMETGDAEKGLKIRELEHTADGVKARNLDVLNSAFATPMDREDIYRAIMSIDVVINYFKTTIREMEILSVKPDQYMVEMTTVLRDGVTALQRGFQMLAVNPRDAEEGAIAAKKAERNVEKCYTRAIAALFNPDERTMQMLKTHSEGAEVQAMSQVMDTFKRREIYRHLSNAGDHLAHAGDVLHDIVVQIS
ncbi:MAG: DUF47 family protein [Magnetococcales bacterium]|nr:DUF47 family protein [Magnetococcales bacterium]